MGVITKDYSHGGGGIVMGRCNSSWEVWSCQYKGIYLDVTVIRDV